jgi:uncharacterized membrane protein
VTVLVLGLVVFFGAHSLRAVMPGLRARLISRLGEGRFKAVYSIASLAGFALIIWGFSLSAGNAGLAWLPPAWLGPVAAVLMLPALVLAAASALPPGHIRRAVRHPLLIGTALWAIAHLFVNGEAAAVVLFAAFLAWSLLVLAVAWRRPAPAFRPSFAFDFGALAAGAVLYAALVWRLHEWLFGVSPVV